VVWAIAEGRQAAEGMHRYLMNAESLVAGHA
jgi:NADPH-dependent glutamate synthase beta subunit-like oxidoreductase